MSKMWPVVEINLVQFYLKTLVILQITNQGAPSYNGEPYPDWAQAVAWIIALIPVVVIAVMMVIVTCTRGGWKVRHIKLRPLEMIIQSTIEIGKQ